MQQAHVLIPDEGAAARHFQLGDAAVTPCPLLRCCLRDEAHSPLCIEQHEAKRCLAEKRLMLVIRRHEPHPQAEFDQQQKEARRRERHVDAHGGQKIVKDRIEKEQDATHDRQHHPEAPDLLQLRLNPEDCQCRKDFQEPEGPVGIGTPFNLLFPGAAVLFRREREELLVPFIRQDSDSQCEIQDEQGEDVCRQPLRDSIAVSHMRNPEQCDRQGRAEDVVEIPEQPQQGLIRIRHSRLGHVLQETQNLPGEQCGKEQTDGPARTALEEARPKRLSPEHGHGRHEHICEMAQTDDVHTITSIPHFYSRTFPRCISYDTMRITQFERESTLAHQERGYV